MKKLTGYISLRKRCEGETKWFYSHGTEYGLWYLTIHAGPVYFCIIGPFRFGFTEAQ